MNITIASPNGVDRVIPISAAMEAHFNEPIQHANTILNQINSGMYKRWFEGKKDMTVIDFGANVGLTGLYFLPACKELIAVEPTPSHHNLLTELMEMAMLLEKDVTDRQGIKFYRNALSDKTGEVVFMTGHATENKITSEDGYGNGKVKVMGHPLSHFIKGKTIDFCKVDIEGGEMIALTIEQLKFAYSGRVKVFFVEVHPAYNGGMLENMTELTNRFKKSGYNVEHIDYQTLVATL